MVQKKICLRRSPCCCPRVLTESEEVSLELAWVFLYYSLAHSAMKCRSTLGRMGYLGVAKWKRCLKFILFMEWQGMLSDGICKLKYCILRKKHEVNILGPFKT